MSEVIVRYVHFIGIIVFASLLVVEHVLAKGQLTVEEIKRIRLFDAIYLVSAVVVMLAGISLWLWVGKPSEYYSSNPVFQAKLGAFVLLVCLSVYPTLFFHKHCKSALSVVEIPKKLVNVVRVELLLLVLFPLLAVFMARGYGLG
jgi:putative membrane protein